MLKLFLFGAAAAGSWRGAASKKKARTYMTEPYDVTFNLDLDGKPGGEQTPLTIKVHPEWAPEGAKRFQDIVEDGVLNDARFFRVVPGFVAQFGIPSTPQVAAEWRQKTIKDDAVKTPNKRGTLTFATSGPDSRTTQMFFNLNDNDNLDSMGFAPFATVEGDGMNVVDKIQDKYKEQPEQGEIQEQGNQYLESSFPDLSYISGMQASFMEPAADAAPAPVAAAAPAEESQEA